MKKNYGFMRFPGFLPKALTLSYDDGVVYDKRLIEIMAKYGIKGTFNIGYGRLAKETGGRFLTVEEALALYPAYDMEVAVHGYKHYDLTLLTNERITDEVLHDRKCLENTFKLPTRGMAYAYGTYNDDVVSCIEKCGIVYSRTTEETLSFDIPTDWLRLKTTCRHANPKLMELGQQFVDWTEPKAVWRNKPQLFYLWGHSYEFNDSDNWHVIEDFFKLVGNRNDTWYATNMQIYNYVKAFDSLVWGVEGNFVYNPSATDVYLNHFGNKVVALAGKTTYLTSEQVNN